MYVRDTVNNKNRVLEVDTNCKLSVNDSTAQASLSAMNGKITACDTSSLATSALQTAGNSSLTSINSALGGTLVVSDSTAQSTLSSINSALGGTLTVSEGVSRNSGSIASSASKSSGDVSSSIDQNSYKKIAVYGSCSDNSGQYRLQISDDDSNYYEVHPNQYVNASNGHFYLAFDTAARYVKFEFLTSATWTVKYSQIN